MRIVKKRIVEAENDSEKQYYIGKYLLESKNYFPLNVNLAIKYFERSISGGNTESILCLCKILIKGEIIQQDLKKAKRYLTAKLKSDFRTFPLYGKILIKEKKIKEAKKYYQMGAKSGESECMYRIC